MGEIKLVVLDYLQYLGRGMKPEEVAVMSKEIKTLALEFEIPFIVIVSLRKEGSGQGRKWTDIEIQDFMGTGSIGYDADAAMIASRKDKANEFDEHGLWVKILKVRNGKLDYNDRYIRFDWEQTRISESWVTSAEKSLEQTDGFKEV
jgi:replicative DNA helicase